MVKKHNRTRRRRRGGTFAASIVNRFGLDPAQQITRRVAQVASAMTAGISQTVAALQQNLSSLYESSTTAFMAKYKGVFNTLPGQLTKMLTDISTHPPQKQRMFALVLRCLSSNSLVKKDRVLSDLIQETIKKIEGSLGLATEAEMNVCFEFGKSLATAIPVPGTGSLVVQIVAKSAENVNAEPTLGGGYITETVLPGIGFFFFYLLLCSLAAATIPVTFFATIGTSGVGFPLFLLALKATSACIQSACGTADG
jgi:hypothetical protein